LKQKQRIPHNIDIREAFFNIRLLGNYINIHIWHSIKQDFYD
jgi:hypothetical protein